MATDFWLSKLFFEMKDPALRAEFAADPDAVMARYHLTEAVRCAVRTGDFVVLAPRVNPYLLRYYCGYIGMADDEFLRRIRTTTATEPALHG